MTSREKALRELVEKWQKIENETPPKYQARWKHVNDAMRTAIGDVLAILDAPKTQEAEDDSVAQARLEEAQWWEKHVGYDSAGFGDYVIKLKRNRLADLELAARPAAKDGEK